MKWFDDLKMGKKLLVGFGFMLSLTVLLGAMAIYSFAGIEKAQQDLYEMNVRPLGAVVELTSVFQQSRVALRDIALAKNPADQQRYGEVFRGTRQTMDAALDKIEAGSKIARSDVSETRQALKDYFRIGDEFIGLVMQGKLAEVSALTREPGHVAIIKRTVGDIKHLAEVKIELANKRCSQQVEACRSSLIFTLSLLVASIVLSVVLGGVLARRITAPLRQAISYATRFSDGDLTAKMETDRRDEVGELQQALSVMGENLQGMVAELVVSAEQVSEAANHLHTTSEEMAKSAEKVAEQSSTVATAGEEMAATSADIARNCTLAVDGVGEASRSAQSGASVVQSTVNVMAGISERVKESANNIASLESRSDQIGEIVGTIEDIADQTNLLALNAAIEAARAGEQGRGFAVVADEVRALAERTTRATKEIAEMIKAIQRETRGAVSAMEQGVKQVQTGSSEAAQSGVALQEILDQVNAVVMQVNQIAIAAEEQTCTTSQISDNMQRITEVMYKTVEGAKEAAVAADQLCGVAGILKSAAGRFRVAGV